MYHPAPMSPQYFARSSGDAGQTVGMQSGPAGTPVRAEKIGKPVLGTRESAGKPRMLGEEPGASGAQLNGIEMHAPPQNPQPRPWTISSMEASMASTFPLVSPSMDVPPEVLSYE